MKADDAQIIRECFGLLGDTIVLRRRVGDFAERYTRQVHEDGKLIASERQEIDNQLAQLLNI